MNTYYLAAAAVALAIVTLVMVAAGIWLNRKTSLSYWESARRGGPVLLLVAVGLAAGVLVATLVTCACR